MVAALRVRLGTVLRCEMGLIAFFGVLALFAPAWRAPLLNFSCVLAVMIVLQVAILPFRGADLVLHDEPPDSPLKYYWFLAIFLATFSGNLLGQALRRYFGLD